jgi:mRNA-degrading endonuclease RelE of RelBE toxin-antitoxin system
MASYEVKISPRVSKFLQNVSGEDHQRIVGRLEKLGDRPRHFGELRGDFWIIYIGKSGYRASYNIDEENNLVEVHNIEKRGSSNYQRSFYD